MTGAISSIRLWQLISPALPVGAYSYSQGLEYAVEKAWVDSEQSALEWIGGQLELSLAALDVAMLNRLMLAWQQADLEQVAHWNEMLLAARETSELRAEDAHMGAALRKLLCELNIEAATQWQYAKTGFLTMFTLAAVNWQVAEQDAAQGFLWAWCENQVMAAIKLIPLGQTAGQRLLFQLAEKIPQAVEKGFALADDEMGQMNPRLAIASALHETQYTRLFRS